MTEVSKNGIHSACFPFRGQAISPVLIGGFSSSPLSLAPFPSPFFWFLPSHTFPELCLLPLFFPQLSVPVFAFGFSKHLDGLELFSLWVPALWQLTYVLKKQLFLRDAGLSTYPGSMTLDTLILLCCFSPPWNYIHLHAFRVMEADYIHHLCQVPGATWTNAL